MAILTIDRLHARYLVDRPAQAQRLDACLRRVVTEELDRASTDVGLSWAEHVCVPELTVAVRLDPQATTASAAATWSRAIAAALQRRIGEGTGVVVYRRTLDALVDLVVSLGRGEADRAWAWRQVGLVGAASPVRPAGEAVARALAAHPELAPAALTMAAARARIPLTASGWVAVARAVQRLLLAPAGQLPGMASPPGAGGRSAPDGAVPEYAVDLVLGAPVGRCLPVADLTRGDLEVLARLAVLCAAPALARSAGVVTAVARTLAARRPGGLPAAERSPHSRDQAVLTERDAVDETRLVGGPSPAPAVPAAAAAFDADLAATATSGAGDVGAPGRDSYDPGPGDAAGSSGVTSAVGGALFLVRIVTELDLVAEANLVDEAGAPGGPLTGRPLSWVAGQLAVRLTGASPRDPVIGVLAGPRADPDLGAPGVSEAQDAALVGLTARIQGWLRGQLGLQVGDDLGWLWRRPATVVAEPGWIEAVFSLDDVDTRVRAVGLDLDPGFVWWLGAVVRFRYV